MKIKFLKNEYWYGGIVHMGGKFPVGENDNITVKLTNDGAHYTEEGFDEQPCDQYSPLFLSSKGRYLHSESAFDIVFSYGEILIDDMYEVELGEGYGNLRGAHLAAANKFFNLNDNTPNYKFFKAPQYNTWIELMYNQNQKQILEYAESMVDSGMPAGVLMIDEGWSPDYGVYDFDYAKFDNPKEMIDKLHEMGFSVMLWVTPLISPDGNCFRELRNTDLLIKDNNGTPVIRQWWNGFSAVLDFTNPDTQLWFKNKLQFLMDEYGVDGFKFDSGDTYLYSKNDCTYTIQEPNAHTKSFNEFCSQYTFNELRNVWDCGGMSLVCRLQDKKPSWGSDGLLALIPNVLTQGILGYYFGCPDMIGGGNYGAFLSGEYRTDEELYLRWLSASLLCPMMQFSISPKRILSNEAYLKVQELSEIREKYADKIISLAENAAVTGEPIIRYLEYEFPNMGYECITNQFMLGKDILVAPILEKGVLSRRVAIPDGKWEDLKGTSFVGPSTIEYHANLDELPIFTKVK